MTTAYYLVHSMGRGGERNGFAERERSAASNFSESYRVVRYLVSRLPAMIAPAWLRNRTQPIAIGDVLDYLAQAAELPEVAGGERAVPASPGSPPEVQIGGPDVVTYGEVLSMMADVLGLRRRVQLPVPFITPRLSSLWVGLVTPVHAGVARPLIESLASDTVVTHPAPASLFDVQPMPTIDALRLAREDEVAEVAVAAS